MLKIMVNNRAVEAMEGESVLSALTRVGIRIPTLCNLPDLPPSGACRICIVELEARRVTDWCRRVPIRSGRE